MKNIYNNENRLLHGGDYNPEIIFLSLQKHFVSSLTAGGTKG